jgi:alkylation response protein AidB-like acyl-CoA dehydrogenase
MDFTFSDEQTMLRDLAREILAKEVGLDHLKEVEAGPDGVSRPLWARLAEANLLGLTVPEALGGMGMGFVELCLLLQEIGRSVAPVPVLPTLVLGGLPIRRFGSDDQQERWLAPLARGELFLTAALAEGDSFQARRDAGAWRLDGRGDFVPAAHLAQRILVPARSDDGVRVFLLDPETAGVERTPALDSLRQPLFTLAVSGARVAEEDVLEGDGIAGWMLDHARVAIAATQVGVSERALEITTDYVKQREQFGKPLGALAAVQHRCADAYVDLESMRWVTWSAAWRLAEERPASREATIAKFWAADAGSRIASATQHLHGGMGVDLDYPIHRYFLWSKSLELTLGAAVPQLARLGRDMARSGPPELT